MMVRKRRAAQTAASSKPRPGRSLETLVATIEKALHGAGIEVVSPAHLADRETGESREVDVLLRVRVGSTQILVAFECRDRGRVQNVQWIEELVGKKNSLGIGKMVAVSSNGFTAASIKKAKALGIDLRVLSRLTADKVRQLVPFSELRIIRTDVRLVSWVLGGAPIEGGAPIGAAPETASLEITLAERCLRVPGTTELFSLQELVARYKSQILAAANTSVPTIRLPAADPTRAVGTVDESELLHVALKLPPLEEVWAGMIFAVESIELDVMTTRTFATIPLGAGQGYASADGEDPPSALRFELEHPNTAGLPERIEVLVFPAEQRLSVSMIDEVGSTNIYLGPLAQR